MGYISVLCCCITLFTSWNACKHAPVESEPAVKSDPIIVTTPAYSPKGPALRVGVVGLVHTHVHWILGREKYGDIEIVGIVEPNRDLAKRYSEQHGYGMSLVFNSLAEMIEAKKPEAVTCFNTTFDHLSVVEYCAPRGIHVMVEKPLAVSLDHAEKMAALARRHNIHLLTNYESTWYASTAEAFRLVHAENAIGDIRKMVFYTGHQGPKEIGCNEEFLAWLTDPILNGAGALMDFGCYGANLSTWLMEGEEVISITGDTQHIKPHIYPRVEDEAIIVVNYPKAQAVIMASWNWPFNRKEMEIYGTKGYIICKNGTDMIVMQGEKEGGVEKKISSTAFIDPFAYLVKVVRGDTIVAQWDPSSLENNLQVMKILESAKQSEK